MTPLLPLLAMLLVVPPQDAGSRRLVLAGLVVEHPPGGRDVAIDFLNALPEARGRVEATIGGPLPEPVVLELVRDHAELARRVQESTGEALPSWVGGVALPEAHRMIVRTDLPGPKARRVTGILTHELAHLTLAARVPKGVPRWFDEGLAQVAEGRVLVAEAPNLAARAFFGALIPLAELSASFPTSEGGSALAYGQAESFVAWLGRHPSVGSIRRVVDELAAGHDLATAVKLTTLLSLDELEQRWIASLREDRSWIVPALGQLLSALFLLVVLVLGARRYLRRRRELHQRWEDEPEPPLTEADAV